MVRVTLNHWAMGSSLATIVTAIMGQKDSQIALKLGQPRDDTSRSVNDTVYTPDQSSLHNIVLDYSDIEPADKSNAILNYLATPSAPLTTIHEISIMGRIYPVAKHQPNWTQLVAILPLLSLSELHWTIETSIPNEIVLILEQMSPPCRLYYATSHYPKWQDEMMWKEVSGIDSGNPRGFENLVGSPILYSLRSDIRYGGYPDFESLDRIFRVLSQTLTLRALDLSFSHSGGCLLSGGQPDAFDFASYTNITFPPLESLALKGYNLDESSNGGEAWNYKDPWKQSIESRWYGGWVSPVLELIEEVIMVVKMDLRFWLAGFERWWYTAQISDGRTSLDCWLEVMDWSKLRTLSLHRPSDDTLRKLRRSTLSSLRELTITGTYPPSTSATLDFLKNLPAPLSALSLGNARCCSTDDLVSALSTHSQSLKSLSIHSSGSRRVPQNQTQIMHFATSCLLLQRLEIDMPYPAKSDIVDEYINGTYAPLATGSKSLREIALQFPLSAHQRRSSDYEWESHQLEFEGMDAENKEPSFQFDREFMESLYAYFKENGGIEKLEIFVGNWNSRNCDDYREPQFKGKFKRCVCTVGQGCVVDEGGGMGSDWEYE